MIKPPDRRHTGRHPRITGPSAVDTGWLAGDLLPAIGIIQSEIALLEQRLADRVAAPVGRGLERAARFTALLSRIAADLYDLPLADAGRFDLKTETVDLPSVISSVIGHVTVPSDRSRISLEVQQGPAVTIDVPRFERAVANVLHHATSAGSPSSPVVVRVEVKHERACISVTDTSAGMTAEQAATLFDRLRPACPHPCVAFGLYVGRRIIEAHGGRIGVENTPGKGARVFMELPLAKSG